MNNRIIYYVTSKVILWIWILFESCRWYWLRESKKCLYNVRLLPSPKYASSCSWCNVEWSTFFQCDQLKGINFTTTLNTMKFCSFLASTWENIPFIIRVKFHISYLFVYVILVQLSRCLWLTFKHEHFLNMELNMHNSC